MSNRSRISAIIPSPWEWVFAGRTIAAGLIAFWLACWLGLDAPYWALGTCYIVAQPLVGPLRAKGLYRILGTIAGAAASIVLVPNLVDAPVLLALALASWIGLCLYCSLLDRTARGYGFLLAGYTAAIISFPSVTEPQAIFDVALARTEEVALGVMSVTMVSSLIWPRPLGPVVNAEITAVVPPLIVWAVEALDGVPESVASSERRRQLVLHALKLGDLITQLQHDSSPLKSSVGLLLILRSHLISLLPTISSIADGVAALQQDGGMSIRLTPVTGDLKAWLHGRETAYGGCGALHEALDAGMPMISVRTTWPELLELNLIQHLHVLIDVVHDVRLISRAIAEDRGVLPRHLAVQAPLPSPPIIARDPGLAARSGLTATITIAVVCIFWIATAWPNGAMAAAMAAFAGTYFATQDDPVPTICAYTLMVFISTILSAGLLFGILPCVPTFGALCLFLVPVYLCIGLLMANPRTVAYGAPVGVFIPAQVGFGNGYNGDFGLFLNSSIALLTGFGVAIAITAVVRSMTAPAGVLRQFRVCWRDIATAAADPHAPCPQYFKALMLDRLGQIVLRLVATNHAGERNLSDLLLETRIGISIVDLRRERFALPHAASAIGLVLTLVAQHFQGDPRRPASPKLVRAIDRALRVSLDEYDQATVVVRSLVALRRNLAPKARYDRVRTKEVEA